MCAMPAALSDSSPSAAAAGTEQRARRMLEAASALFIERGYDVNMAAVAQRAGVAKQTVYHHFGTKEALFRAAVDNLMEPVQQQLDELRSADLGSLLRGFARQHLARFLDPRKIALSRRLVAEAERFPDAAAALFQAGADRVRLWLAQQLDRAAAHGTLNLTRFAGDAGMAAEMLLGQLAGLDTERRRFGLCIREGAVRERWIDVVVANFLTLSAVNPSDAQGSDSRCVRNPCTAG